ncbi:hypothetical protein GGF44_003167, partial [Coemansia sp. RSA 1694]
VLKCRAVGFGSLSMAPHDTGNLTPATPAAGRWSSDGVETFPDADSANGAHSSTALSEECVALKRMAGLRRLKRLDFRFNRCTIELYAPPPPTMAASALDNILSPQIPSSSVMGDAGLSSASPLLAVGGASSATRFDEEVWIRQDHAHLASLKLTRQTRLIQRRDNYWAMAASLFPRLEELDGIKEILGAMKSMLIPEYKVVMLGTGGVGKSMLTTRFINGEFSHEYDPTIEDSYRKQCQIDGDICILDILDTAGQEEYAAMRDYHIRSGHGFIIVYSVTATSSLAEAEKLAEHVRRVKDSEKVAIVLVGNKCDLVDMRTISTLEGERTARRMRSGFYETSAKKRINVDDMFIQSVRRIKYFGKQARTSGTGSSTSQESKGSAQSDRRDTIKPEVAKPKTNSGSSTKSWMPTRKSTPPPPPLAVVDDTSDIIDSYYAIADDYRIPSPTTKHRNTAAVAQAD